MWQSYDSFCMSYVSEKHLLKGSDKFEPNGFVNLSFIYYDYFIINFAFIVITYK
jgi:hypothetical protein